MSYPGILGGALIAYPVVGQYTPASYCHLNKITESGSADYGWSTSGSGDYGSGQFGHGDLKSTGFSSFEKNPSKLKDYYKQILTTIVMLLA